MIRKLEEIFLDFKPLPDPHFGWLRKIKSHSVGPKTPNVFYPQLHPPDCDKKKRALRDATLVVGTISSLHFVNSNRATHFIGRH